MSTVDPARSCVPAATVVIPRETACPTSRRRSPRCRARTRRGHGDRRRRRPGGRNWRHPLESRRQFVPGLITLWRGRRPQRLKEPGHRRCVGAPWIAFLDGDDLELRGSRRRRSLFIAQTRTSSFTDYLHVDPSGRTDQLRIGRAFAATWSRAKTAIRARPSLRGDPGGERGRHVERDGDADPALQNASGFDAELRPWWIGTCGCDWPARGQWPSPPPSTCGTSCSGRVPSAAT